MLSTRSQYSLALVSTTPHLPGPTGCHVSHGGARPALLPSPRQQHQHRSTAFAGEGKGAGRHQPGHWLPAVPAEWLKRCQLSMSLSTAPASVGESAGGRRKRMANAVVTRDHSSAQADSHPHIYIQIFTDMRTETHGHTSLCPLTTRQVTSCMDCAALRGKTSLPTECGTSKRGEGQKGSKDGMGAQAMGGVASCIASVIRAGDHLRAAPAALLPRPRCCRRSGRGYPAARTASAPATAPPPPAGTAQRGKEEGGGKGGAGGVQQQHMHATTSA